MPQPDKWNPDILRSIGRIDFIAREVLDGVRQGIHRSIRRGFSSEFFDYKMYQDGDDPRKIDWRLFAKTRKYFVKRFEAETSMECMLLVDCSPSMQWCWQDAISKREYCSSLAASIGLLLIEQRDHVGLLTFGNGTNQFLPPRSSIKQLSHLFGILGQSPPDSAGSQSLRESIHELKTMQRHRGLLVLMSDLEVPSKDAAESLKILASRGDEVILFHILDIAEITLPFGNTTHLEDSETGQIMPVTISRLKQDHPKRIDEFRQFFRTECRKNRITYVPIDTSTSYVKAIIAMDAARKDLF